MTIRIPRNSRLRFADLITTGGVTFWDTLELPVIRPQNDDMQYRVQDNDRIDLLAHRFYGDPGLWWVIAAANDMEILPTDLTTTDLILIPAPRYVQQQLFNQREVKD